MTLKKFGFFGIYRPRNGAAIGLLLIALSFASSAGAHDDHGAAIMPPREVLDPVPPASRMVQASGDGLFAVAAKTGAVEAGPAGGSFVKRTRIAQFDASYRDRMLMAPQVGMAAAALLTGQDPVPANVVVFKLPLFSDASVSLYKTGMTTDNLGNTIWTGRVLGAQDGEATLVFGHDQVAGSVRIGAQSFTITPMADGSTRIIETNSNRRPHADPLRRPAPMIGAGAGLQGPAVGALTPATAAAAGSTIVNVLIAYTPAAQADDPGILNSISLAISYTNQVLAHSGINAQLNLVGTMPVGYQESANEQSSQILNDLTDGIGAFASVHARRDALRADLVSVWTHFDDACGLSWVLQDVPSFPTVEVAPYGYNVISTAFGNGCLTDAVAHEFGHNMGAKHDRYKDDPNDQLTQQYNFGYVDVAHRIMTIMSYPDQCEANGVVCAQIPYHSSPSLTYQGNALGIADSQPNSADNVHEIQQIAPYIAKFRSQAPAMSPLVAAILPSSRSVQVNSPATFFMTLINTGSTTATNCQLDGLGTIDFSDAPGYSWRWQTTDPATNQTTGTAFTPISIPAGGAQSFVVGVKFATPVATTFQMLAHCDNADSASIIPGVNTLQLTVDINPVPDVIALALTPTGDGTLHVPTGGANAFAVATANIGIGGTILVSADTGSITLPVLLSICQTQPSSGRCLATPSGTVVHSFTPGETPTFGIFATATGGIAFDPSIARIYARFKDAAGGTVRGSTSVALRSP